MPDPTSTTRTGKSDSPAPGMTLRVYTVSRDGTVTQDTGTRRITPNGGPPPLSSRPPLCVCSRCLGRPALR
ncbi:hypothetical protein GCM10010252_17660 [Streptomyces aureoverticillatus]|nr:hypothetical protein GCM10010252_17660 [Streptomyces aureoverticillatus]